RRGIGDRRLPESWGPSGPCRCREPCAPAGASCDHRRVARPDGSPSLAALALLIATGCGGANARGQGSLPADALRIDGAARLDELAPTGLEHFQVDLLLHNPGGPRRLTRALVLLASSGGWSFSLGDPIEKHGSL